ncbi:alcohol dehydrogenase superfamily protein [Desarmillaria tabescens]|uniref:Alcohol dehydrogenase superfamily protein n=1 Tax=Armillaria tabescens TaxID=1929756 RepID=A0AA39NRA7_ARMTA|nr:alcohol dehydrogenase superfamily protein [Desarmillaria tabescens]KAK0470380.1 alcohol dehydrogenase superfamily protein [Desarmillaria tabescens]
MANQIPKTTRSYYFPALGSYTNLTLQTTSIPSMKASHVLVKVHAVSLQYRDLLIASDKYPAAIKPDNLVPCSDMAGEVVTIGSDVTCWKVGDRVCANFYPDHLDGDINADIFDTALGAGQQGVLTEYRTFNDYVPLSPVAVFLRWTHPRFQSLVKIPEHLSYEEASTLPCAGVTAYNALMGPKPVKAGDSVLVLGTGGVSIFGLQLAVASGATVIATSSSDAKLAIAKKLGATHTINYNTTPDWDKEVLKLTDGRGVDHVLEVGGSGTLEKSISAARYAGSIHMIGFVAQNQLAPMDFIIACIRKAIILRGIAVGSIAQFKSMNRLLQAHPESTRPVIDKVFSFEEVIDAYAHLESQEHVGKVVIHVVPA